MKERKIVFELCSESIEACVAAEEGGAHRIELCSALALDGLTPSHGMTQLALERCRLPIHVIVRPRAGDFVYSEPEFATMKRDVVHLKTMGVAGVVLGILHANGRVDIERTRALVELAAPLEVTFHRAFDATGSLDQALEDVVSTGCHRVLTSGGALDVVSGAPVLAKLVEQAGGRVQIALGGGLRIENASDVARITGAPHYHGSLQRDGKTVDPEDVRSMVAKLRNS